MAQNFRQIWMHPIGSLIKVNRISEILMHGSFFES